MSAEKKSGGDLEDDTGLYVPGSMEDISGDTPFDQAIDLLSRTRGDSLELMCRTTHEVAEATAVAYSMVARFGTRYVQGRIEQIQRLTVSIQGKGRAEVVQSLQAGSGVSDAYYEAQSGANATFTEDNG